ncbi:MAG: hypothetical protein AMS20_17255 [Gemmatimonas sp. SG8_28]|nr:MAG: hypothetical protein AMS20_17255 [Gemmatimonas sp. SG8_28]
MSSAHRYRLHRLGDFQRRDIRQRITRLFQSVASPDDAGERQSLVVFGEHGETAHYVGEVGTPLAADVHVLLVDVQVRVDRNGTRIGIVPRDHVGPTVTHQIETLRYRLGIAAGLDHHIGPATRRHLSDCLRTVLGLIRLDRKDRVGPHVSRQFESS